MRHLHVHVTEISAQRKLSATFDVTESPRTLKFATGCFLVNVTLSLSFFEMFRLVMSPDKIACHWQRCKSAAFCDRADVYL